MMKSGEADTADRKKSRIGIALILTAGISWGMLGIFVRYLTQFGFNTMEISALRSVGAAAVLIAVSATLYRTAWKVKLRDLWCMAGCGLLSITLVNVCYFYTIRHTTVNIAVVLLYTSPAFVMLLSLICFKEKLNIHKVLALAAVSAGCVLVSGVFFAGARISWLVLLAGLGAGFCYALYTVFGRFAQKRGYGNGEIILWTFIFSGSAGIFMLDWPKFFHTVSSGSWSLFCSMAGLIILSTLLPYCSYTAGLRRLTPSIAAIVATIEPLAATLAGVFIFGEVLTMHAVLGMFLILAALLICRE